MQQFRVEVCTLLVAGLLFFASHSSASEPNQELENKWPRSRIVLSISSSINDAHNVQGDVIETLKRSIDLWVRAADVRIETVETDVQSVSQKGNRGDGISLITAVATADNVRLFPNQADSPAAATRLFTDKRGNITEADIVLNPFAKFSTDGTVGTYDLQSVITHEIGHLLGLDHSPIWGSVMFAKSGVSFGSVAFVGRRESLPETDAAAVRALYGARADDSECCGLLIGRVSGIPLTAKDRSVSVWLEELATGRVVAGRAVLARGEFELGGLRDGTYLLRVAAEFGEKLVAFEEATIQVSVGEIVNRNFNLLTRSASFTASLFGTSPQIGRLPGVYRSAGYNSLFIGGHGLDSGLKEVLISGTDIAIARDAFRVTEYSQSVKVINFDLPTGPFLSRGEYTLIIEDNKAIRRFLPGALVVID